MGFHIVNLEEGILEHSYVQNEKELANNKTIKEDTIIYQGEENWEPVRVGDSEKYKNYCNEDFRAGLQAQQLFKEQAKKENLILEELNQDLESFNDYLVEKDFTRIKRGDFLIRNHGNLEIEVKCKQFYPKKNPKVFYLNVDDFIGHFNMQTYTKTPIVLAIFQRLEDGSIIKEPNFVLINTINEDIKKLKIDNKNNVDCYKIPISYLKKDYKYIKELTW